MKNLVSGKETFTCTQFVPDKCKKVKEAVHYWRNDINDSERVPCKWFKTGMVYEGLYVNNLTLLLNHLPVIFHLIDIPDRTPARE